MLNANLTTKYMTHRVVFCFSAATFASCHFLVFHAHVARTLQECYGTLLFCLAADLPLRGQLY